MKKCMLLLLFAASVNAAEYKPIILDPNYAHDRWVTQPRDIMRHFRAYTASFDSNDEDIRTGVPEWVAYEIKPSPPLDKSPARPSKWIHEEGISPPDKSYVKSGFDRGHMCMKNHAWRLGANADWNTHTTINACPQYPTFNRGIWLDLENKCSEWADEKGPIWIITGPVFFNMGSVEWLGGYPDYMVAVPQAYFKIIVEARNGTPHVLALLYPHHKDYPTKGPWHHSEYLVSVDYIEMLTGLDFFTEMPEDIERILESRVAKKIWGEMVYQMAR